MVVTDEADDVVAELMAMKPDYKMLFGGRGSAFVVL
jgi:hypothetical protein